jgi:hypothetical protein
MINGKFTLGDAIFALNPLAEISNNFQDNGEELFSTIIWHNGNTTNITKEQAEAKIVELTADYDAQEYARNRKLEYPSIEEAVHAILDDDLENLQILRQAVKDKYEKP